MSPTKFIIVWPNGEKQSARSATEFLLELSEEQWEPCSIQELKQQLSDRAKVLTGKFIHPAQADEPFLYELCRVGFLVLVVDGETVVPNCQTL